MLLVRRTFSAFARPGFCGTAALGITSTGCFTGLACRARDPILNSRNSQLTVRSLMSRSEEGQSVTLGVPRLGRPQELSADVVREAVFASQRRSNRRKLRKPSRAGGGCPPSPRLRRGRQRQQPSEPTPLGALCLLLWMIQRRSYGAPARFVRSEQRHFEHVVQTLRREPNGPAPFTGGQRRVPH